MSTKLDYAMQGIFDFAKDAQCQSVPEVRITFADNADQMKFKMHLISQMDPTDIVSARVGGHVFNIVGVTTELANKDRGPRAQAEAIIKSVDDAIQACNGRTISVEQMVTLRTTAFDLLRLVRGS